VEDRTRAIDRLKAWGGTALYEAVVKGLQQVASGTGRKAVVVFTDGDDRSSPIDARELRRAIEENDAVVYFVAAGDAARPGPTRQLLEELAEISGGAVLQGRSDESLREAFAQVRAEIRNQYLLTYVPARLAPAGTYRPLSVKVACDGCRVRARKGYRTVNPNR